MAYMFQKTVSPNRPSPRHEVEPGDVHFCSLAWRSALAASVSSEPKGRHRSDLEPNRSPGETRDTHWVVFGNIVWSCLVHAKTGLIWLFFLYTERIEVDGMAHG